MGAHKASASVGGRWSRLRADIPEETHSRFFPVLSWSHVLLALDDQKPELLMCRLIEVASLGEWSICYCWVHCTSNIWEARSINRQWLGYWIQNKTPGLSKSPSNTPGFKKFLWPHNSLFGSNIELLEVGVFYCSFPVSKEYQEEKSFEISYLLDSP